MPGPFPSSFRKRAPSPSLGRERHPPRTGEGRGWGVVRRWSLLRRKIPVQVAHNLFVQRINRFVVEMEDSAAELVDTLASMGES